MHLDLHLRSLLYFNAFLKSNFYYRKTNLYSRTKVTIIFANHIYKHTKLTIIFINDIARNDWEKTF